MIKIKSSAMVCIVIGTVLSFPAAAMTYANVDDAVNKRTYGSYTGVGTVNIMYASSESVHDSGTCTGTLIASNVVITAAHCLRSDPNDPIVGLIFDVPSYGERTESTTFYAVVDSWQENPAYDPADGEGGDDIGLFTLSTLATGHEVYGFYEEDPIGKEFTRVGTGSVGGPDGTGRNGVVDGFVQREGNNIYEYRESVAEPGGSYNEIWSDFDDGTDTHDVFGRVYGTSQTGIEGEHGSAPGDSGAATFIDGKIVGITSGGKSGSILRDELNCGQPTDVDPIITRSGACTNSSVGEINVDSWVQGSMGWINSYLASATVVPEPATWLMMFIGFFATAIGLRRDARPHAAGRHAPAPSVR